MARYVAYGIAGAAWAAIAWIAVAGGDPRSPCLSRVYREPVTGRLAAYGGVRIDGTGRVACPR